MKLPAVTASPTLAEQMYDALERAIIDGTLRPGQRLAAKELAEHFGVSRIPLRESLRALDANGWVEIRPRQGAYVRRRSVEELRDLFEMRALLEVESARLAAERRDDAQLARLHELVEEGQAAAAAKDWKQVAEINRAFHSTVADCTQNQVLTATLKKLSLRVQWYFSTVSVDRGQHSMEEHANLVKAIDARDADWAAEITAEHIRTTRTALEEAVTRELATKAG